MLEKEELVVLLDDFEKEIEVSIYWAEPLAS